MAVKAKRRKGKAKATKPMSRGEFNKRLAGFKSDKLRQDVAKYVKELRQRKQRRRTDPSITSEEKDLTRRVVKASTNETAEYMLNLVPRNGMSVWELLRKKETA